jgi:hypothetical protein
MLSTCVKNGCVRRVRRRFLDAVVCNRKDIHADVNKFIGGG